MPEPLFFSPTDNPRRDVAVLYGVLQIAETALWRLANEDYRGNRPNSALDAERALEEMGRFVNGLKEPA